jgi:hypothetical protein
MLDFLINCKIMLGLKSAVDKQNMALPWAALTHILSRE